MCGNNPQRPVEFHTVPHPDVKSLFCYVVDYLYDNSYGRIGMPLDLVISTEVGEPKKEV